jgi:hypothetical protein
MGKNSPRHLFSCLTRGQAGVRPGIVVKEKDVFHVSVRTDCRVRCRGLFKVSLYRCELILVPFLSAVTAVAGLPLRGLSSVFVSPLLKCLTQRLSVFPSAVCPPDGTN